MASKSLKSKVLAYLLMRERGKRAYAQADVLLDELVATLEPGQSIALGKGRTATLVDLFADKNKVFRAHGIGRFEQLLTEAIRRLHRQPQTTTVRDALMHLKSALASLWRRPQMGHTPDGAGGVGDR